MQNDPVLERRAADSSEARLEQSLRPQNLDEFVGQGPLVANLRVYVQAAKGRGEPLDHVLLSGLPGLGKTTLAHILARELGVACRVTSGPALTRPGDLAGILTDIAAGDVLFVDEIHRLPAPVEEYLYSAMEDFAIDITIDQGQSARSVRVPLQRFTLVGATTREGLLSAPFRSRFGLLEKLELYPASELERIVRRTAAHLGTQIDDEAARRVSRCSRGTPRIANRIMKRLRDFAEVEGSRGITTDVAERSLARLGIDAHGLGTTDRKILVSLERAGGGPVGLKTIAVAVGEDEETVEDVYEPFLVTEGWILRTPRGRKLTDRAAAWLESERGGAQ
ncbi:MAG: Holliday junction ATP-dependent DNA helicase RuvB [Planctomycetes bacterium]|nr:Holliday junction ATP-dependent DNA helicase RuvB [Planctomycetota bacterium]